MWDAGLITRVKDRKLNEILIFASMAKIDQENIDEYIDIIEMLGDDINGCDALLDTEGQAEIALEAIDSEEYRCRLSPAEIADEDAFNSMKVEPEYEQPDLDYVKRLIVDAVVSIKVDGARESPSSDSQATIDELDHQNKKNLKIILGLEQERNDLQTSLEEMREELAAKAQELSAAKKELEQRNEIYVDAISALKDENAVLRSRNSELSAQLDYCQESVATIESERDELRAALAEATSVPEDEPEESVPEEEVVEPAEPVQAEPVPTEEPKDTPAEEPSEAHIVDQILTKGEFELLDRIVDMKSRKIDEFIDKALDGEISEDISDDIVTFLKDDVKICETLRTIDCTSLDNIIEGLRSVLNIVENSTESRYHKIYQKSLTPEEFSLEDEYVSILSKIHYVISSRYLPYVRGVVS